jgi:SAM-dependent methyltransferase
MMGTRALSKYENEEFSRAQKTGRQRLYPSIFAANYLVLSNRREHMKDFLSAMPNVGHVLDVGAQYCPYYPFFENKCESYTSLDMVDTPLVDLVCNAEQMKANDCSFDLVLCTQVLEHTQNPQVVIDECYRVLKPGGTLIVTVPSVFPVHGNTGDFWRFMPDGLEYALRNFSDVHVRGELDFAESVASANCYYGHVIIGKLGKMGSVIEPLWHLATNLAGKMMSYALRPLIRNNFTSFSGNLWADAKKAQP